MNNASSPAPSSFPAALEIPREIPDVVPSPPPAHDAVPVAAPEEEGIPVPVGSAPPRNGARHATDFLDWDRERFAGAVPRRIPLSPDEPPGTWAAFPHARYVLCVLHGAGLVEQVYVTSLLGRRDSLIPAGAVERIVSDDRSVTVVVDGRPYLYAVEAGTTVDLTNRRIVGAPRA